MTVGLFLFTLVLISLPSSLFQSFCCFFALPSIPLQVPFQVPLSSFSSSVPAPHLFCIIVPTLSLFYTTVPALRLLGTTVPALHLPCTTVPAPFLSPLSQCLERWRHRFFFLVIFSSDDFLVTILVMMISLVPCCHTM